MHTGRSFRPTTLPTFYLFRVPKRSLLVHTHSTHITYPEPFTLPWPLVLMSVSLFSDLYVCMYVCMYDGLDWTGLNRRFQRSGWLVGWLAGWLNGWTQRVSLLCVYVCMYNIAYDTKRFVTLRYAATMRRAGDTQTQQDKGGVQVRIVCTYVRTYIHV